MDRLLAGSYTAPANLRLAGHLRRSRQELFLFLERDDVEATNWPAEHAIRPAVVNRKSPVLTSEVYEEFEDHIREFART